MAIKLFQNRNEQEGIQLFAVRNMLPLLLIALLCSFSFGATRIVPTSYPTIQQALNACDPCDIVEVRSNAAFTENLVFPVDANYVTLQAGTGFTPTITVSGSDANTTYIHMRSLGQAIKGFTINFSGSAFTTDNNSVIIRSTGGASTVQNCKIFGPATDNDAALGWIMGITAVANVDNVEVSQCRMGVVCDLNDIQSGFQYHITNSKFYGNHKRGIVFDDCNAVMDNCQIYSNGNVTAPPIGLDSAGNMLIDGNEPESTGRTNVLITNSVIRNSYSGRNINVETTGTATIQDSIIKDAPNNDCILLYGGTLNLERCIIHSGNSGNGGRACLIVVNNGQWQGEAVANIDHCTLEGDETRPIPNQWAINTATGAGCVVNFRNSILNSAQGLYQGAGTINTNFNDVTGTSRYEGNGPTPGPNDINVDPLYIQTDNDANTTTWYVLQPYTPVLHSDEFGDYLGAKAPITGYEKWPADLGGVHGVDLWDYATFAKNWFKDNTIPAGPNDVLETFEGYSSTGASGQIGTLLGPRSAADTNDAWRVLYAGTGQFYSSGLLFGTSTLTLMNNAIDANSGYGGTKAMTWVYDVNQSGQTGQFSTEILYAMPAIHDFNTAPGSSRFNNLRIMLRRHAGNSPDSETYMYVRLLKYPGGTSTYKPDKYDIKKTIVGGSTSTHPGEWYPWTINLAAGTWDNSGGPVDMKSIKAIILGIQGQPNGPWGPGKGTIDVDQIELVDLPACSAPIAGDLTNDCIVNFADVREFVKYWLDGK